MLRKSFITARHQTAARTSDVAWASQVGYSKLLSDRTPSSRSVTPPRSTDTSGHSPANNRIPPNALARPLGGLRPGSMGGGMGVTTGRSPFTQRRPSTQQGDASVVFEHKVIAPSCEDSKDRIKIAVGSSGLIGPRRSMEDASFEMVNGTSWAGEPISFFGVLDGHGGVDVARDASRLLPDLMCEHRLTGTDSPRAIAESLAQVDKTMFQRTPKVFGGCCAVTLLIADGTLYVANLGDSRAVLCDNNLAVELSRDHKPTQDIELERIKRCGGFVREGRINGMLNVSRALGDYGFKLSRGEDFVQKDFKVSNVADVSQVRITDSTRFVILGCDGLWDVMSSADAVRWVSEFIGAAENITAASNDQTKLLNAASLALCQTALDNGSMDNVSVSIISLH